MAQAGREGNCPGSLFMMGGTWRRFHPARLLLAATIGLAGCDQEGGGYLPVAAITHNGFARDEVAVAEARGREIHLWGFVDSGNLYGDEDTRRVPGDWWSGEGPSAGI